MDDLIDGSCSITMENDNGLLWKGNNDNVDECYCSSHLYYNRDECYYSTYPYYNDEFNLNDSINLNNEQSAIYLEKKQSVLKRNNLIIWDWDNSIFPTYVFRTRQDQNDKQFISKLKVLVSLIEKTFTEMISIYGASNIVIVTNASANWINKCLNVDIVQKYFIKFQNLLKKHKILTISASKPEITKKYPSNHYKWKHIAFTELFNQYFEPKQSTSEINCITSIGDSMCEYKASHSASKYVNNRVLNRIKLKTNPSINDMIYQFQNILNIIDKFKSNMNDIELDYYSSSFITDSDFTC